MQLATIIQHNFSFYYLVSPEGIVSTNPTNTTLTRGNSVTFDCQTDAGPQTSVFWFHNATNVFCNVTSCYDYINEGWPNNHNNT